MRRSERHVALFALCLLTAPSPRADDDPAALSKRFHEGVAVLAADGMEGRGIGTRGLERSGEWVEKRLEEIGLEPAFGRSYRQSFPIKTGVMLRAGNQLSGVADTDWMPLGFSSSGSFSGEIAFVGYGIDAPAIGYREIEGIDLRGRIALMLRYEPQERDEGSPFDGKKPSRYSSMRYRVHLAKERGAAAVVFVTGPLQDEGQDKLPAFKNDGPESPAGIPVIQVKTSVAAAWLNGAGVDLKAFQEQVDRDLLPRSVARTGMSVKGRVALQATTAKAFNVAGVIPGKGDAAKEVVVIGAHYDHLGSGGAGSMRPNVVAIHNGADDNASGVVVALLAAEKVRATLADLPSHRTVLVALFSGEEVGLAGSSYFVEHSPIPLEKIRAMVNLDMVGRLREGKLAALGSESAPEWGDLLKRLATGTSLEVMGHGDGYGPSDQTSFYAHGIPVVHFFTGAHEQYHTPDDDVETLNDSGAAQVAAYVAKVLREVALPATSLTYVRPSSAPLLEGDSRGYGAYLGTVPDYTAMEVTEGGVLLSDVRPGGPAEAAGILGKDRIVEMAGTKIENLYDMTFALQDHKPGETIDVAVIRSGKRQVLRATLGDRTTMSRVVETPAAASTPEAAASQPGAGPPSTGAPEPAARTVSFYADRPGAGFVVNAGKPFPSVPEEKHLKDVRQLTFGGENAEAYFSPDGKKLILQATPRGATCDQEYVLDLATGQSTRVSDGKGRTTCGYFDYPEADRIIYSSTEAAGPDCPPPPDRSKGYVWAIYDSYDIYEALPDGSHARRLTETPGYDAEATWCHRGGRIVFTSTRDGDIDLYAMDEAGEVTRLTNAPGYDGGAFYSPDCSEIVWRASRPEGQDLEEYRALLGKGLVRPTTLEIFLMKSDGTGQHPITHNGAANFCPTFHPDGRRVIWSSNVGASPREFDLWIADKNGGEPERVTTAPGFDGFPHFSPDGTLVVWGSNRADLESHETNIFLARWVD